MMVIIFLVFLVSNVAFGANILGLFDIASPSHHIWNMAIINALAEKGHNITLLAADPVKNPHPNVHAFELEKIYQLLYGGPEPFDLLAYSQMSVVSQILTFGEVIDVICQGVAESDDFKTLLDYPDDFKFDLVLHDFSASPFILGFLHKFNYPPLVSVSAFSIPPYYTENVGGQKSYAYVPYFDLSYTNEMSFGQRFYNTFIHLFERISRYYYVIPKVDRLMRKSFQIEGLPYAGDLSKRTALMLLNSHPAVDYPEPLPPNVILVGGLQIAEPKPLPKEMDEFLSKGKKGSILMSLGTNVKSTDLKNETLQSILDTFHQLPDYNFIWKFEADSPPAGLSGNVMLASWLPQSNILAHKNVKAFVSHCGLLSIQESVWRNVPVVGIPFFADQQRNSALMKKNGIGTSLNWVTLSTESFKNALLDVLENPRYRENMEKRSKVFRDQPKPPLETAIWWIEWVMRNPNIDHLRSPALEINFLQLNLFDIYGSVLLGIFIILYLFKKLLRKLCYRKETKLNSDKKQK